jgi:acetyl-CoA C-acetyltransferase
VKIIGSGHATDTIAFHQRPDLTALPAVSKSASIAYKMSGKTPKDIQLCEVHDCFTISEIMVTEELGFIEKGKGGPAAASGATALGGKQPINTSGGLKSKGHPVGATGVAQAHEIVHQLRHEAGKRQVKDAKIGFTCNFGGFGNNVVCLAFVRE